MFAASPTYAVALAAKAIQGIGSALAFVAAARYLAGLYGERRNHFALGLYGAGFPLGSAIALVAMPPLAAALGGWRGAFWIEAAFVGSAAALWWSVPAVPPVARPGNIRDALRCPNCWWTSLQHAAGFGLAIASGTWITVYLLREFHLPLEAVTRFDASEHFCRRDALPLSPVNDHATSPATSAECASSSFRFTRSRAPHSYLNASRLRRKSNSVERSSTACWMDRATATAPGLNFFHSGLKPER